MPHAPGPRIHALRVQKDRKTVAGDPRHIYTAVDDDHATDELQAFAEKWDGRYPTISHSWLERWEHITPFLAQPPEIRRVIYTTDESIKAAATSSPITSLTPDWCAAYATTSALATARAWSLTLTCLASSRTYG